MVYVGAIFAGGDSAAGKQQPLGISRKRHWKIGKIRKNKIERTLTAMVGVRVLFYNSLRKMDNIMEEKC